MKLLYFPFLLVSAAAIAAEPPRGDFRSRDALVARARLVRALGKAEHDYRQEKTKHLKQYLTDLEKSFARAMSQKNLTEANEINAEVTWAQDVMKSGEPVRQTVLPAMLVGDWEGAWPSTRSKIWFRIDNQGIATARERGRQGPIRLIGGRFICITQDGLGWEFLPRGATMVLLYWSKTNPAVDPPVRTAILTRQAYAKE